MTLHNVEMAAREESARAAMTEASSLAELAGLAGAARHGDDPEAQARRDHLIRWCRASWRTPYRLLGEATGLSRARLAQIVADA